MKKILFFVLFTALLLVLPFSASAEGEDAASADGVAYATFSEAVDAAKSGCGKVELLRSLSVDDLATITVTDNLEIDGKGYTLLFDKDYTKTLFDIKAGGTLVVKNLNVFGAEVNSSWTKSYTIRTESGYAYDNIVAEVPEDAVYISGATITNAGSLVLENCSLRNIAKKSKNFLSGSGNVTISGGDFTHNISSGVVFSSISGGDLLIEDFTFEENCGWKRCGMFSIWNVTSFTVKDSEFINNAMTTNGGVFTISNVQKMHFSGSTFNGNVCGNDGGVFQLKYTSKDETLDFSCVIEECDFDGNKGLAVGDQSLGGTMWIDATPSFNKAVNILIKKCNFTNNLASMGGAIDFSTAAGQVLVEECIFTGNEGKGGAVSFRNEAENVKMKSCVFTGNSADYGGAVYGCMDLNLELEDCIFTDNTAEKCGGALYFKNDCNVILSGNTVVTGNTAQNTGGGVYLFSNTEFVTFEIKDGCIFANNTGVTAGDELYAIRGTTLIVPVASEMDTTTPEGKQITGWYWDYSNNRCSEGKSNLFDGVNWNISESMTSLILKAAWRGKRIDCTFEWDDNDNQDGLRKDAIIKIVALDSEGNPADEKSMTIPAEDAPELLTFVNLEFSDSEGQTLEYILTTELPEGYVLEQSGNADEGFNIVLKHMHETVSGDVEIRWEDNHNKKTMRPEKIKITMFKNGETVEEKEIDIVPDTDATNVSFGEFPKYENGILNEYTFSEETITNYVTEIEGNVVINGIDVLRDADMTEETDDTDSLEGGDGVPDYKQAAIIFGKPEKGELEGRKEQVFTLGKTDNGFSGTVKPEEVLITPEDSYVLEKWVKNDETDEINPFDFINVAGGEIIIFTAKLSVNPKTGDSGIMQYVMIFTVCAVIAAVVPFKKRRTDNN